MKTWGFLLLALTAAIAADALADRLPTTFTANIGQWDSDIQYRCAASGGTVWLAGGNRYYQLDRAGELDDRRSLPVVNLTSEQPETRTRLVMVELVDANTSPLARPVGESLYPSHFYLGNDPAGWRVNVPNYVAVEIEDVYPGINQRYYLRDGLLEYDFIVAPGAEAGQIRLRYSGLDSVSVDSDGSLLLTTGWGTIKERPPVAYQLLQGKRTAVAADYKIASDGTVTLDIQGRDPNATLVVDPVLDFSTYLGGSARDEFGRMAVGGDDRIYVMGTTVSGDFPDAEIGDTVLANPDVVVACLDSTGRSLLFSLFIGGSSTEMLGDLAVAPDGSVYLYGTTWSPEFALEQPLYFHGDAPWAFLTRLSADGDSLLFSTFLGGSGEDLGTSIAVNPDGEIVVCGQTTSADFLHADPPLSIGGPNDGFYARIRADNSALRAWRVIGGSGRDLLRAVALAVDGSVGIGGRTESPDFPLVNAYDSTYDGWGDIIAMKVDPADSTLFSTYIGGLWDDWLNDLVLTADGGLLLTGTTTSDDFPLVNDVQGRQFDQDMFLTRVAPDGQSLMFSTLLGGEGSDVAIGLDVDDAGRIWIAGTSWSSDFPQVRPFQAYSGLYDATLCGVTGDGSELFFSSCFGGVGWDYAYSAAVDSRGRVCLGGQTSSLALPLEDAIQPGQPGAMSFFVARFDFEAACCEGLRGNIDYLWNQSPDHANIADVTFLVQYLFAGGPEPTCPEEADVVPSIPVELNIVDLNYLVDCIFRGGPALPPCPLAP